MFWIKYCTYYVSIMYNIQVGEKSNYIIAALIG